MKNIKHLALLFIIIPNAAHAMIDLTDTSNQWRLGVSGFVELDTIVDSTRSLLEVPGNTPVDRPDVAAGARGRTQFSIRNSRLALTLNAPKVNSWDNKGYFEFDLLGVDPTPGNIGANESSFFNSPTFRIRHLYFQTEHEGWQLLFGQTWTLLGWQPYYFLNSVGPSPLPGMLYYRTAQIRAQYSSKISSDIGLQSSAAIARPPQRDAMYPDLEAGLRMTFDQRKSGFTGGATGARKTQPMSIALSGVVREFAIPQTGGTVSNVTQLPGAAIAADVFIPVIASSDGTDVHHTLSLLGEFTKGRGYGDQFVGWTGNLANPLTTALSTSTVSQLTAGRPLNLDAGLGDYDTTGAFELVQLQTFNFQFQYFPSVWNTWLGGGYSQLKSNNISNLTNSVGLTSAGKIPYTRDEAIFANIFRQLNEQWRVGFEFDQITSTYADGVLAHDNRYELSTYFIF